MPLPTGVALRVVEWSHPRNHSNVPIVLVHGLSSNARLWDGVAREFVRLGHPVVAVDQRGHGRSEKPDGPYDMSTVATDLASLLEQLAHDGWHRPLIIGQSWGGNVVVETAYHRPDLVRGVCAVDGGAIELREHFPEWESCKAALSPPRIAGTPHVRLVEYMRSAHPDWSDEAIAGAMENMEHLDDGTVRPWLSFERHLDVLRGLWEHSPSQRFPHVTVPVLFTPATHDPNDGFTASKRDAHDRATALLRTCRVHWFSPADHDVHAQKPREFVEVVTNALNDGFFS